MVARRVMLASGLRLLVHQYGSGVPVLLVHAWGETHRSFDRLVPLLAAQLRLVVPDQRGVGGSDKPADGYSLGQAAGDLVELLDALNLASVFVVGTSSGGYVAQQIAVAHPSRVYGLVLVGSPRSLAGVGNPFGAVLDDLCDPVTADDVRAINGAIPFHGPVPADFLSDQEASALTIPARVWREAFAGLLAATPPLDTGRIAVPTLVLWGADDSVLPRSQADALTAEISAARLVVYDDTGHLVLWERPNRVAADVLAFVAAVADS
jgi:pimeloyl-ACP methyl ester carboxylesterase